MIVPPNGSDGQDRGNLSLPLVRHGGRKPVMLLCNTHQLQTEIADDVRRRQEALRRLGETAADAASMSTAQAALGVVHELALMPETAEKALALLQELQVHQVELDAQIESSRHALAEADLAVQRRQTVYDRLPVACLSIDASGRILEANLTACQWLCTSRSWLMGERLGTLLSPADEARLQLHMAALNRGQASEVCPLALRPQGQAALPTLATIAADEQPERYLLVMMAGMPA